MLPFPSNLHGKRISLELIGPQHWPEIWMHLKRDRAAGGKLYHWVENEADVTKYITEKPGLQTEEIDYAIFNSENMIGSFHIHDIRPTERQAEIGYALEKNQEGSGYISEALKLVEQVLINKGFRRLVIRCDLGNQRSIRVAERNGFQRENQPQHTGFTEASQQNQVVFTKDLSRDASI